MPEIDTCWVKYAGEDPSAYVRKYAGRCPVIHLKDYVGKRGDRQPYALIQADGEATGAEENVAFCFKTRRLWLPEHPQHRGGRFGKRSELVCGGTGPVAGTPAAGSRENEPGVSPLHRPITLFLQVRPPPSLRPDTPWIYMRFFKVMNQKRIDIAFIHGYNSDCILMPKWRNGRRQRLKISCPTGRARSNRVFGTTLNSL